MEKIIVTGAAGFVGSHLCDYFLAQGSSVLGLDNFSTGSPANVKKLCDHENFSFKNVDLLDKQSVMACFEGAELVVHMAANADIQGGLQDTARDINQNILVTHNVLEAMRAAGSKRIVFASSAAVLGEPSEWPTPENCAMPVQTSLYGTSKLACEGLISSYCAGFGFEAYVYRFVSLLGPRYPHGHVIDFYKQLKSHPEKLFVLGDGTQRKSYLHISDCVGAVALMEKKRTAKRVESLFQIYNIGNAQYINVSESINVICSTLNLEPEIVYGGGKRGWVGDSPFVFLDTSKARSEGWSPNIAIKDAISDTVVWLDGHL